MDEQRHVIKRQTVEITLAKQENAWQMQQKVSGIFQQHLPSLLDRCLSELSSPDCLHRIERLELDLGELDGNRLEAELLEKIETALRVALSEQIASSKPEPVAAQPQTDPASAHLELFELFIREGYLPWWAETGQRQLPEKSFAALINTEPNALARLLPKLIREPRSRQRLISYFDDNHLAAMMALLCFAPQTLVTSLLQTLLMVQAQVQQSSRVSAPHLRATLWQSLLQVAIAGDPVIFRHGEFLAAVMTRWTRLLGLSQPTLAGYLQRQLSSRTVTATDNEWLQALRLSASIAPGAAVIVEESALTFDERLEFGRESAIVDPDASVRKSLVYRHRLIRNGYLRLKKTGSDYATPVQQSTPELLAEHSATKPSADELADLLQIKTLLTKNSSSVNEQASADMLDTGTHEDFYPYPPSRESEGNTVDLSIAKSAPEGRLVGMEEVESRLEQRSRATQGNIAELEQRSERLPIAVEDLRGFKNLAGLNSSEFVHEGKEAHTLKSTLLRGERAIHDRLHTTTNDSRLASAALSKRYALLKKTSGNDAEKPINTPVTDHRITQQSARKEHDSLLPKCPATKNSNLLDEQTGIDTVDDSSAFSDTDALYINNAGLCLLWPYLASFFERLELVQNGRFRNHEAKQCAVSLLHYLVVADTEPPEYFLPFNKLLCAMAIDDVFELETPLTTAQIEACDELLAAVIDNAPVLNEMSVNGFRGSFLLREGSLSASEGCWLLRVERKTYDLVLEQFPWSWQWFKLPWMEHPFRVEW